MGLFRSETMCSGTLVLPVEKARHFVDVLGGSVNVMFQDLHAKNISPHRPFKRYVQRIEEVERQLRFLIEKCKLMDLPIAHHDTEGFLMGRAGGYKLDQVETEMASAYSNVKQLSENQAQIAALRNASIEERYVIESASMALFSSAVVDTPGLPSTTPPIVGVPVSELGGGNALNNVAQGGVVGSSRGGAGSSTGSRGSPAGTLVGKLGVTQADVDADFFESQKLVAASPALDSEDDGRRGLMSSPEGRNMGFNNAAGVINQVGGVVGGMLLV